MEASKQCNVSSQRNNQIQLTHYDETKKRAHGSQIVRAKKTQVEPRWAQPLGLKPDMQTVA